MSGFTTAFPTSLKGELPRGMHDFTNNTGHVFRVALGKGTPAGTYGAGTTNYSNLTGNGDEVTGPGYTTGGFAWTPSQNITPQIDLPSASSCWSWAVNPQWTGATFNTSGCIIYNNSQGNAAVYVGSFGGSQVLSAAALTLILPTNAPGSSILALE
jgi:hypothetical protein